MIEIIISTIFILYILLTKYKYETFKVIRTLIKNYKEIPLQNITLSENNEVTVEDKRIKIVTITIHGNKHMVSINLIINCLPHFYHVQSQNINFILQLKMVSMLLKML